MLLSLIGSKICVGPYIQGEQARMRNSFRSTRLAGTKWAVADLSLKPAQAERRKPPVSCERSERRCISMVRVACDETVSLSARLDRTVTLRQALVD